MRLPLDKSWIKCLTMLEIQLEPYYDISVQQFLNNFPDDEMSDDVKACRDLLNSFENENLEYYPVRNFRSLAVAVYKYLESENIDTSKIQMGTQLRQRKLIDENSSQLKTAELLVTQDLKKIKKEFTKDTIPYHLNIATEAVFNFNENEQFNIYREDRTIAKQFEYFINKLQNKDVKLRIDSAEDIPLAYMFDEISLNKIKTKYPQMINHESDRISSLTEITTDTDEVDSNDHRIVMACAMASIVESNKYKFTYYNHKDAVDKSFPKFWEYYDNIVKTYK
jgi:hypothetical protein